MIFYIFVVTFLAINYLIYGFLSYKIFSLCKNNPKLDLPINKITEAFKNFFNTHDIGIEKDKDNTGYDTDEKKIFLEEFYYNSDDILAYYTLLHELSHAEQDKENFNMIKWFNKFYFPIRKIARVIIPISVFFLQPYMVAFLFLLVLLYGYLVVLPIELDADKRVMRFMKESTTLIEFKKKGKKKPSLPAKEIFADNHKNSIIETAKMHSRISIICMPIRLFFL